jgi:hypothetical protein
VYDLGRSFNQADFSADVCAHELPIPRPLCTREEPPHTGTVLVGFRQQVDAMALKRCDDLRPRLAVHMAVATFFLTGAARHRPRGGARFASRRRLQIRQRNDRRQVAWCSRAQTSGNREMRRPQTPRRKIPEAVLLAKRLRRASPKTGKRMSLRKISAELAAASHVNERGVPFNAGKHLVHDRGRIASKTTSRRRGSVGPLNFEPSIEQELHRCSQQLAKRRRARAGESMSQRLPPVF